MTGQEHGRHPPLRDLVIAVSVIASPFPRARRFDALAAIIDGDDGYDRKQAALDELARTSSLANSRCPQLPSFLAALSAQESKNGASCGKGGPSCYSCSACLDTLSSSPDAAGVPRKISEHKPPEADAFDAAIRDQAASSYGQITVKRGQAAIAPCLRS